MFTVNYEEILEQVQKVDPVRYAHTRNYTDGSVTRLSPYISRGVISCRQVLDALISKGHAAENIEKFIQELAWREYWQQKWIAYRAEIDKDILQVQPGVGKSGLPEGLLNHNTGIQAIDNGIKSLYQTGYMHNHMRMYVASIATNIARCHWYIPARWMYYHLLDADWASNALSWQWVCGSGSKKKYFANQQNINTYCHTQQTGTFLDVDYNVFADMDIPSVLESVMSPVFYTDLPDTAVPSLDPHLPTLIYNFYNLDPRWRNSQPANRILLLEPSVFMKYPVSRRSIDFCLALAARNIPGVQIFVAEFSELKTLIKGKIYFKEHPLNKYEGQKDAREWMTDVQGDFPSFFAYWKQCKKQLFLK